MNGIRQVIREIICEREKELVYLERMKDDPTFIIKVFSFPFILFIYLFIYFESPI